MKKLLVLSCLLVSFSSFAQTLKIEEIFGSMPGDGTDTFSVIDLDVKTLVISENVVAVNGVVENIKVLSEDSALVPFSTLVLYTTKKGSSYKGNALLDDNAYSASCYEYQFNPGKVYCYINAFKYSGYQLYFELKK